jgi:hypothetical protein
VSAKATAAPGEVWPIEPVTLPASVGHATGQPVLTAIRTGRHHSYERLVLDFSSGFGDASVGYAGIIREDPSNRVVPLLGHAYLYVVVRGAVATWNGVPHRPYPGPFTVTPNYPALKQVSIAGDFEGVLSFGIGLDRVAGFKVSRLTGPDRLVIDIAERPQWRMWPEDNPGAGARRAGRRGPDHQRGVPAPSTLPHLRNLGLRLDRARRTPVRGTNCRIDNTASGIARTGNAISATSANSISLIAETR